MTRYAVKGAQLVIDALGRRCPVPVIELARHLRDVDVGEVIAVLADDAAARVDAPRGAECADRSTSALSTR